MYTNDQEILCCMYCKTCLKWPLKKDPKLVFKTEFRLMHVKGIAEEHSAILLTCIKLPSVFKTFVLSIFEWPLKIVFFCIFSLFMK